MSFIEDIKALVGIKAEDHTDGAPMPEETPAEETPEAGITPEEQTAIVSELMQIIEPRMVAIEDRLTAIEAALGETTEQAEAAAKVALEAQAGVKIIAKATKSTYVAPVAGVATEAAPAKSRVRKNY
jgi:hypothetical protein